MPNVAIVGWYDHSNVGDESYKRAIQMVLGNNNCYFSERYQQGNFDLAILGGGNVCSNSFLNTIEKYNCPKIAFSVGVIKNDPVERMKMFKKIFVRDHLSHEILKSKNIDSTIIPDAAFILQPDKNNGKKMLEQYFKKHKRDLYEKVVAVVVNSYLCTHEDGLARDEMTFQKVSFDLARIADNTSASFVFIPFGQSQPYDDRIANYWTSSRCKYWKKNYVVTDELDAQQTLDLISACTTTISSRLHSSIYSTMCGIPFVDLTHHSKNKSFLKEIGKEEWSVDYWNFSKQETINLLNDFLNNPHDEMQEIAKTLNYKILEVRKHEWL